MKGLLIKDMRLMKNNMMSSFLIIACTAVGMAFYMEDLTFLIVYLALLGATFTTSTLSYDEYDNGYAFLFCLPVGRNSYVAEKYVLGLLLSGGGWLSGTVLAAAGGVLRGTATAGDMAGAALACSPVPMLLLAFLLPLQLKFGGEKGRIVKLCIAGGVVLAGFVAATVLGRMHLDLESLLGSLSVPGPEVLTASAAAASAAVLAVSYKISVGIVKKWEL